MSNRPIRGGRYLAEERGTFDRPEEVQPIEETEKQVPKEYPLMDFLDDRSRSFFAWVAEHGWLQRTTRAA